MVGAVRPLPFAQRHGCKVMPRWHCFLLLLMAQGQESWLSDWYALQDRAVNVLKSPVFPYGEGS